jgi:hypothetical protein
MKAYELKSQWKKPAAALAVFAAVTTVACGGAARDFNGVSAQQLTANQGGAPVLVSCEPHQRTLVKQVVVNGAAVSQVECVAATNQTAAYAQPVMQPMQQIPAQYAYTAPAPVARPVYRDVADTQIVPVRSRDARAVRTRQVIVDEPVRKGRSVKKSAIIIGSSAGVGAGVGAAVGGKKGALIGAAIGGGGAAIWDQMTRRK